MNTFSIDCECGIGTLDIVFGERNPECQCIICGRIISASTVYEKVKQNFLSNHPITISHPAQKKKLPKELITLIDEKIPLFSNKKYFSDLDNFDWAWLLVEIPNALQWCECTEFSEPVWDVLLESSPSDSSLFMTHDLICGKNLVTYLPVPVEFEKFISWGKIPAKDWIHIMSQTPQYTVHCPWTIFDGIQWIDIFRINTCYVDKCPWENFSSSQWVELLKEFPQFAEKCPWTTIKHQDWVQLCRINRGYVSKCSDWSIFDAADWLSLFAIDFTLSDKCPGWGIFSSNDWVDILKNYPNLSFHCNWKLIKPAHWKTILQNDLKEQSGAKKSIRLAPPSLREGLSNFDRDYNNNSLKFEDFQHPEYLAIYNLTQGKNIGATLERFSELASRYLNWDTVNATEFLSLLARIPQAAANLNTLHWKKIVSHVNTLNDMARKSIKNVNKDCWEKRSEILANASTEALVHLTGDEFYTLIDFMDWEWSDRFDWSNLNKARVLNIAVKHPEIAEKYGWDKFSADELIQLAIQSPIFLNQYGKSLSHKQLAKILEKKPEMYPFIERYFSLHLPDFIRFQYYGNAQLLKKVAWYRLFVTQISIFILGWLFLLYGECGYLAFAAEHPIEAKHAFYIYIGFALVWSCIQAYLHQYCGKEKMCRFLGITTGLAGVMFYGYTFFLTCFNRTGYWTAVTVYALYMLIMFSVRRKQKNPAKNETPPPSPGKRKNSRQESRRSESSSALTSHCSAATRKEDAQLSGEKQLRQHKLRDSDTEDKVILLRPPKDRETLQVKPLHPEACHTINLRPLQSQQQHQDSDGAIFLRPPKNATKKSA